MARKQMVSPPDEGSVAPEFNLPGAQGGQLRLGMRTAHGPVIVAFYRGAWSEECVEYFKALAEREREINVAGATLVGIGAVEPEESREFVRETGFKSYVLYDYLRVTTREYGLLQQDPEHGDNARPAVFLIGGDDTVLRVWLDERPVPEDLLARVSDITGLPKEPEEGEAEEKPKRRPRKAAEGETSGGASGGDSESGEKGSAAKSAPANSGDDAKESAESAESGEPSAPASENAAPEDGERPAQDDSGKPVDANTPADETKSSETARAERTAGENEPSGSPEGGSEEDKNDFAARDGQSAEAGPGTSEEDGTGSSEETSGASQGEER